MVGTRLQIHILAEGKKTIAFSERPFISFHCSKVLFHEMLQREVFPEHDPQNGNTKLESRFESSIFRHYRGLVVIGPAKTALECGTEIY